MISVLYTGQDQRELHREIDDLVQAGLHFNICVEPVFMPDFCQMLFDQRLDGDRIPFTDFDRADGCIGKYMGFDVIDTECIKQIREATNG